MKTGHTLFEGIDAVRDQHMQVHVEVERASEALYHGHRALPGTAGARQVGSPDQIGLDGAENHRETARERLGLGLCLSMEAGCASQRGH